MSDSVEKLPVLRLTRAVVSETEEAVAREFPLTIILNDRELVTLLCSPEDLLYLAVGFLDSEGLIESRDDIRKITIDDRRGVARVVTKEAEGQAADLVFKRIISSGCGKGASFYSAAGASSQKVESRMEITPEEILALVNSFQHNSSLYQATHGVHSAALCDNRDILVFNEDIGRHNAVDKVFGRCLLEGIVTGDKILITTGRITSEILHKVARRGVPIIISISAPTDLGVKTAEALNVTLVAMVRGQKMSVYAGRWRVGQPSAFDPGDDPGVSVK